jgi:hypothetical protein
MEKSYRGLLEGEDEGDGPTSASLSKSEPTSEPVIKTIKPKVTYAKKSLYKALNLKVR